MTLLLLVILVLVLMGGIPAYTYSSGMSPLNSIVGVVLAIVLIMLLFGLLVPYVPYHRMW